MTETVSKDTAQEGRQCDGIDQRKEKAEGTLRTYPESVSKAHRINGQRHHQEGVRDGMSERLQQGLQLRNQREVGVRPRQLQGVKRIVRQMSKPNQKKNPSSTKDNLLTGGSAEQVALELHLRSWKSNGGTQEPPKTRSLSKDHQERRRQRLQGAKRSLRQRL